MRLPPRLAAGALRLVPPLTRTWRLRDARHPRHRVAVPLDPAAYAVWHEHILPATALFRGRGFATLASRSRDGALVARALSGVALVARGSSSRGGAAGLRALARAGRAGRPLVLTPDGPRGPRHRVAPGIVRAAALTGLPIVPVGFAAVTAVRLRSWDRFLVPFPGTAVYVSRGEPIRIPRAAWDDPAHTDRVRRALLREGARAEAVAREAREGRAVATRPVGETTPRLQRSRVRRTVERWLRARWRRTPPPVGLRVAERGFRLARTLRHGAYDAGLLASTRAPVPVVSVGGATVGGSGKTPLASEIAGMLREHGAVPAVLTRGYLDEVRLHARFRPDVPVWGYPDRIRVARRAAAAGASVLVLDDGFQHRRLARELDVLALDRDALRRTNGRSLPAGPFREDVERAAARADVIVITGREPPGDEMARFEEALHARLRAAAPTATLATLRLEDGPLIPLGPAAAERTDPHPAVVLTGIMKPNLFFERMRARFGAFELERALPDHGLPAPEEWSALLDRAGEDGLLMTPKDAARLAAVIPARVPAWIVSEIPVWTSGESDVRARLAALLRHPARGSR